jgi:protein-tyrosine-phosphatase
MTDSNELATPEAAPRASLRNGRSSRRTVLLVCGGNTCRSPMAKAILEQKLKALGMFAEFEIDSAASSDVPTSLKASDESRVAMVILYGEDLLASHESKRLTPELVKQADLILVMAPAMKKGLPKSRTYTLREYAGETGTIADPYGDGFRGYLRTANDISNALEVAIPKLLSLRKRHRKAERHQPV